MANAPPAAAFQCVFTLIDTELAREKVVEIDTSVSLLLNGLKAFVWPPQAFAHLWWIPGFIL